MIQEQEATLQQRYNQDFTEQMHRGVIKCISRSDRYLRNLAIYIKDHLNHPLKSIRPCGKESTRNSGDTEEVGLTPGSGRSLGGGHGNPLQYSCLENPMGREAWQATIHGVAKSWTQLYQLSTHIKAHLDIRRHSGIRTGCSQ